MQKRVVLVSAAVAVLGLAAAVLGFVAENTKSKAFVGFDGRRCVYRRTPALACGVAAALLALTGLALATAASSGYLRRDDADEPATGRRRAIADKLSTVAWVGVAVAVVMFLYGAAMNWGGTRVLSSANSRRGRRYGRAYYYRRQDRRCPVLKSGLFATASVLSAAATGCGIAAYVYIQRTDDDDDEPAPGVAMEQPQWAPPMAYPAAPPQYGHGGYGPNQPAGTN